MDTLPPPSLDYAAPRRRAEAAGPTYTVVALICYAIAYLVGGVFAFVATELDDRGTVAVSVAIYTLPTTVAFAAAGTFVLIFALIRHPFRKLEWIVTAMAILYWGIPLAMLALNR